MQVFHWLLAALAGWTAIGLLGTALALLTGARASARRGLRWIIAVWAVYLATLLAVARFSRGKVLAPGEEECFGKVCYSVLEVSSVPEFKGQGAGRLVQVQVRSRDLGPDRSSRIDDLSAYLVDRDGRRWGPTPGVGGVPLSLPLSPGGSVVADPVFRVGPTAQGLALVLTRGFHGWGWLVIGDTDVPGHRKTALRLP